MISDLIVKVDGLQTESKRIGPVVKDVFYIQSYYLLW